MVQGTMNKRKMGAKIVRNAKSAKVQQKVMKAKKKTKAALAPRLPSGAFRGEAIMDRQLSKEIGKKCEKIATAKCVQTGGKLGMTDLQTKGKELAKELRRKQVTKKVSRVEEKLKVMIQEAENGGNRVPT